MNLNGFQVLPNRDVRARIYAYLRSRVDVRLTIPVDLERLIEGIPNTFIEPTQELQQQGFAHAAICKVLETSETCICVDYDLIRQMPWSEYNRAIGEELAHLIIHQSIIQQVKTLEDFRELQLSEQWIEMELSAKYAALHLRMPDKLLIPAIERYYADAVCEFGFADIDCTLTAVVHKIGEDFQVRHSEVIERLKDPPMDMYSQIRTRLGSRDLQWPAVQLQSQANSLRQLELFNHYQGA